MNNVKTGIMGLVAVSFFVASSFRAGVLFQRSKEKAEREKKICVIGLDPEGLTFELSSLEATKVSDPFSGHTLGALPYNKNEIASKLEVVACPKN